MQRLILALLLLAACDDVDVEASIDASIRVSFEDSGIVDAQDAGAPVDAGMRLPRALDTERVWIPAGARYVNEPTLIRAHDGTWHMFSNGAEGRGNPWVELQLLHATAPTLHGPWTDQPDILTTRDADAVESSLHAPFVLRDGDIYRIYYYDSTMPENEGLRTASSLDLFHWTRDREPIVGGRDAMILRHEGASYLYSVGTVLEADDEIHDIVRLQRAPALRDWVPLAPALRNPRACPDACWGWYESPFVVARDGGFYLFTTFTSSSTEDYENTTVYFSRDPTHFSPEPVATLHAHGGEVHEEGGALYLTHGGWPDKLTSKQPGLYVTRLAW
ncbi:MAG TPA: hypothetical protein VFX59_17360 [Polyangiales bacterium]|nr:hypothetical protein [Polyangiales bacterium]